MERRHLRLVTDNEAGNRCSGSGQTDGLSRADRQSIGKSLRAIGARHGRRSPSLSATLARIAMLVERGVI